jgi:hypothetical protein
MDATPSTPSPKQSKAKLKTAAAPKKEPAKQGAVSAPTKTKKARIARVSVAAEPVQTVATTVDVVSTRGLVAGDLQHEIAMAAYFLAEQRNFTPGHELDDWLQAERQVREVRAI